MVTVVVAVVVAAAATFGAEAEVQAVLLVVEVAISEVEEIEGAEGLTVVETEEAGAEVSIVVAEDEADLIAVEGVVDSVVQESKEGKSYSLLWLQC